MAEKPRFRRQMVFAKNLGFGVGFGYRNNTIETRHKVFPILGKASASSPSNNTDDCGCQANAGCPANGCETVVCLCYRICRFIGTCLITSPAKYCDQ